jgi:K+-sensing histidine kinase KdpD
MSKSVFIILVFCIIILLPLSPIMQVILGLFILYVTLNLFQFKEPSVTLQKPTNQSSIAMPKSSQVNPFVNSSAEMRTAIEHDIQTPLTKIIAQTDYLIASEPNLTEALTRIKDNAAYLSVYTTHYFEFFGLKETELRLDHSTDIAEVLRTCLIEYLEDFDKHGVSYRFDIPDNPIQIITEANLLDRALTNILHYLFASLESFKDIRITLIIRKVYIEINIFIDTDEQTRESLCTWKLFGHQDASRNTTQGLHHLNIVLANQMILKHGGRLTVNEYASNTLHYQIQLKNPHMLFFY